LEVLGRENDENAHSDVIRWLLDPRCAPTIAPAALLAIVERCTPPTEWQQSVAGAIALDCISVRREYVVGEEWHGCGLDRVDLVISGPDFVLAIENKLWSFEHDDQTGRYWRWLCSVSGRKAGLLLSPRGMPPGCPDFTGMSYLQLVACLLEGPVRRGMLPEEDVVLRAYLKTLQKTVLCAELRGSTNGGVQ
jgi:hypothetical protein